VDQIDKIQILAAGPNFKDQFRHQEKFQFWFEYPGNKNMRLRKVKFKKKKYLPNFYKEWIIDFHYDRNRSFGGLNKHIFVGIDYTGWPIK